MKTSLSTVKHYILNCVLKKLIMVEKIYLAGGCFWCTEAVFQNIKGVQSVCSGYIGGSIKNPTYKEICSGLTGHAEAIEVVYENEEIHLEDLLNIFWTSHDPTTLNQQGADKGTQYRSAIFYTTEMQKEIALHSKLNSARLYWEKEIVTEINKADIFYPAEVYHQNYYNNNANQMYCQVVIHPKLIKLRKAHSQFLKN